MTLNGIGILGGSFDPPHIGHVRMAQHAIELGVSRVLVIPAATPPHKSLSGGATAQQRLLMAKLAFQDLPDIMVSDMELRRDGKSYTVDTLRALHALYPSDELSLIMGADMFMSIEGWHDFSGIISLAGIVAFARGQVDAGALQYHARHINAMYGAKCLCAPQAIPDVSSTGIRAAIAFGSDVAGIVPEPLRQFLVNNRIYR